MNITGERILIFGDSISHHGSDNAPEIWDVDAGSNRVSGQPGDLLASMLVEQGAQAARVNARVGRSAFNFFGREAFQALLNADAEFAPTKVVIVLGTNDLGLDLSKDGDAMELIKGFYEKQGAEVWAIGPFTYAPQAEHLNVLAPSVVDMMSGIFGSRFIDGRPLSVQTGRAGDGVHFGADSARQTATNMLAALQSAISAPFGIAWKWLVAGAVAAAGAWWLWSRKKAGKGILGSSSLDGYRVAFEQSLPTGTKTKSGHYTDRGVDERVLTLAQAEQLRRAYKRKGYWAWVEDEAGNHVPVEGAKKPHPVYEQWRKENLKGNGTGPVVQPAHVTGDPRSLPEGERDWRWGSCSWRNSMRREGWQMPSEDELKQQDLGEYCNPQMSASAFKRCTARSKRGLGDLDARYQGDAPKLTTQEARIKIKQLFRDPDPNALDIAQDIALEHRIKLSELTKGGTDNQGSFWIDPDTNKDPSKQDKIVWSINKNPNAWRGECTARLAVILGGKRVGGIATEDSSEQFIERYQGDEDYCRRAATSQAWALAKDVKQYIADGGDADGYSPARLRKVLDRDNSEPAELYGSGLRGLKWKRTAKGVYESTTPHGTYKIDGNNAGKNRWTVTYPSGDYGMVDALAEAKLWAESDLESRAKKSLKGYNDVPLPDRVKFRKILHQGDAASMDVAEDFAEERGLTITDLTTAKYSADESTGTINVKPNKEQDVYNVWWEVIEHPEFPGRFAHNLDVIWTNSRGEAYRPNVSDLMQMRQSQATQAEAKRAAAADAWAVAKALRRLPPSAVDDTNIVELTISNALKKSGSAWNLKPGLFR